MLLNDFYKINNIKREGDQVSAAIHINKEHDIFKGHFPGNPVTPGVCIMQIVKELTEKVTESTLFMEKSSNIKFKAVINPEINPDLYLQLDIKEDHEGIRVKNTTKFDDTIALTLTAFYKRV